ncbi:Sporulation protein RMD1 [Diplonema papillatum]|nr:Sporulation protein RMD1 [Diplonema papillatum]KAJ9445738.1 Sporulation protein RMD1 [Diplonema papillatum]
MASQPLLGATKVVNRKGPHTQSGMTGGFVSSVQDYGTLQEKAPMHRLLGTEGAIQQGSPTDAVGQPPPRKSARKWDRATDQSAVVRSFRRRRQVPQQPQKSQNTVRAVCTCAEFNLKAIADHYRGRGLIVNEKEEIVWITVKVPTYKFDSEPDESEQANSTFPSAYNFSQPWLDTSESKAEDVIREYVVDDTEEGEDRGDLPAAKLVKPGREYEYNIFFHNYGVVVWWSPFPPTADLEVAGLPLLHEVYRMRSVFEVDSREKVELDTCRWAIARPSEEESPEVQQRRRGRPDPKDAKEKGSYIDQDCFFLSSPDPEFMLAYGCGLAQSAKLSEFEDNIEEVVENTKEYPISMARTGQSCLTRKAVARIRGSLFLHRMDVNLNTDILETPDVFWNRTDLEPYYLQARRHMEISHRTEVLNKRYEIVNEMFELFHDELNNNHSNYLEWIIIWLILVECIIATLSAFLNND